MPPRPPPFSVSTSGVFDARNAGARPKTTPQIVAVVSAKKKTGRFMLTSRSLGMSSGASARSARVPHTDNSRPPTPEASARTTLSVTS